MSFPFSCDDVTFYLVKSISHVISKHKFLKTPDQFATKCFKYSAIFFSSQFFTMEYRVKCARTKNFVITGACCIDKKKDAYVHLLYSHASIIIHSSCNITAVNNKLSYKIYRVIYSFCYDRK
jgi:hypothetical protein